MTQTRPLKTALCTAAAALAFASLAGVALAHDHGEKAAKAEMPAADAALDAALAGEHRSAENKARDTYRHPKETLAFFGLKPDMTVVEIAPGGEAWYTEVLAPVLRDHGQLYLSAADINSARRGETAKLLTKLADNADVYKNAKVVNYDPRSGGIGVEPGTADMVLVFRHMHGVMHFGLADTAPKAYFDALKPGGILGVVQHRLPESVAIEAPTPQNVRGYVKESDVIALLEGAGFELVEKSEINANAKDTADHKGGVWALPPMLRHGDEDRDKYLAIGESDRMTLKFRKPE